MPSIEYPAFKRTFQRRPVYAAYIFFGDEPFFFEEGVELLKGALLPAEETSTISHFDAKEAGLAETLDELRTPSLFAPNRMVVVENAARLFTVRRGTEAPDSDEPETENQVSDATGNMVPQAVKVLETYLQGPAPRAFLILKCPPPTDRKKQLRFSPKMRKAALLIRCPRVYDNQLVRWATAQIGDRGHRLTREAGQLLVDYVGGNLFRLNGELEKLARSAGERKSIEVADVLALVGADPSASILALAEAVANKDVEAALLALRQMMQHGDIDASGVLALLGGRLYLRRLWEVHELRRAGLSREEIASRLKLKDFPLSRIEDQLSRFSPDELRQKLKALVETDSAVKTTRLPDNTALEMLVIELCQ